MKNIFELPQVKYMVAVPNQKTSEIEEVEKTVTNLQLFKLQRTNIAHSKFVLCLNPGESKELEEIMDEAIQYVKMCVVDATIRNEIANDSFACLSIFQSEEVQNNIADFLNLLSAQLGVKQAEEEPSPKNK